MAGGGNPKTETVMALDSLTTVANLALDHLGEPSLDDWEEDIGTTADSVRLQLPQALNTCLEGHAWSFATRTTYLKQSDAFYPPSGDTPFQTADADPGDWLEPATSTQPIDTAHGTVFDLPADCLRVLTLSTSDFDIPQNLFAIQGRYLLLRDTDAPEPILRYIASDPPVDEWPLTFVDAVAFLIAARIAPKIAQSADLEAKFTQLHEIALGKARSKDTREVKSRENFGPRQLAARCSLVRARYGPTSPPY